MMRRVHVDEEDLRLIEAACRTLTNMYRQDAERHTDRDLRESALQSAERFERIADRMKRFRSPGS